MTVLVRSGLALSVVLLAACVDEWGDGKRVSEERDVSDFTAVDNNSELDVLIEQGEEFAVTVAVDSNVIGRVETRVDHDTLRIRARGEIGGLVKGPHVRITMPTLTSVRVSGAGNVVAREFGGSAELNLKVSGAGDLAWQGDALAIDATVSGAGDLELEGSTDTLDLAVSGAGDARARGCVAQDATVVVTGAGDATVEVHGDLDAEVSGSGDLDVWGDPHFSRRARNGAGSLISH